MPGGTRVLLLTHLTDPELGLIHVEMNRRGIGVLHRNLFTDGSIGHVGDISGIVSLGGQMSVTALNDQPFLAEELALLRDALRDELPVLGLCLGAQLLALAAGGRVTSMARLYIGWPDLVMTEAARADLLFTGVPPVLPILKWHSDAIEVPASATVLATTDTPGAALFRAGPRAWGSQMHLECDAVMLFKRWLLDPVEQHALAEAGLDALTFAAESRRRLPVQVAVMAPVMARFATLVAPRASS
jgi:GMP synthase-like glutamine amidotransferase